MSSRGKARTENIPLGSAQTSKQDQTRKEKVVVDSMMAVGMEIHFQMQERSEGPAL